MQMLNRGILTVFILITAGTLFAGDVDIHKAMLKPFIHCVMDSDVAVCSDVSENFSRVHCTHASLVWRYFKLLFTRSPGPRVELYYTKNHECFTAILKRYPTVTMKGARQLTAYWAEDHRRWFIMPYADPDFGTQLHELSHDFLYATWPAGENCPWFKEGLGMYFESGHFDPEGKLVIERPMRMYHDLFMTWHRKNQLIPWESLLSMHRDDFYRQDYTKTYAQSMMLIYLLVKQYPSTMALIFNRINAGMVPDNKKLLSLITASTGQQIRGLGDEAARIAAENR